MSSATSACWLREVLRLAGIGVSIFSGHSTWDASTSAAAGAADWSSDSVFRRSYYHLVHDPAFGRSVLTSGSTEA